MSEFHERLSPVRRRQHGNDLLRTAAWGLLLGGGLAIALAIARLAGGPIAWWHPLLLAGSSLAGGLALGGFARTDWHRAAAAVDTTYGLKDRTATALDFLAAPQADELQRLQIQDAVRHLRSVDARQVAPLRLPRALPLALVTLLTTWALLLLPTGDRQVAVAATVPPVILREAETLQRELVGELERMAQAPRAPAAELQRLAAELKQQIDQLKQPGADQADALATLSQMQAALGQVQRQFHLESVEAGLQQLAEAISPAAALQAAAQALQDGQYNQAANQLQNLDAKHLTTPEARTVAEELQQLAEQLRQADQEKLSEGAEQLAKGLQDRDADQARQGAEQLADQVRGHGLRQEIAQRLASQIAALAQSKASIAASTNGGQQVGKSDSPKTTWGQGETNQPLGQQETQIDSTRQREDLTGTLAEGPSERESTRSADARQQAARSLQEKYDRYRKQTEAVLHSENLPLGHRQTIRRYFESIRPDGDEAADALQRQFGGE